MRLAARFRPADPKPVVTHEDPVPMARARNSSLASNQSSGSDCSSEDPDLQEALLNSHKPAPTHPKSDPHARSISEALTHKTDSAATGAATTTVLQVPCPVPLMSDKHSILVPNVSTTANNCSTVKPLTPLMPAAPVDHFLGGATSAGAATNNAQFVDSKVRTSSSVEMSKTVGGSDQDPPTAADLRKRLRAHIPVHYYRNGVGVEKVAVANAHRTAVQQAGINPNHPLILWVDVELVPDEHLD